MRLRRSVVATTATALALLASACGGSPGTQSSEGAVKNGGQIIIRGCTPQNPLIGTMTGEVCGGWIVDWTSSRLVHYNTTTSAPENDVAESIKTDDSTTFTVTLKKGRTFSDGTEIKAKNFVEAWNIGAYGPNGHENSHFFEPIAGYDDLQCGTTADGQTDCATAPPKAKQLSGLVIKDDYTFTITTSSPTSNLPIRLGYSAFMPQPDSYLANPSDEAYGKKPVASGAYQVINNTATEIVLQKNTKYNGPHPGHVDKVIYRIYNDPNAAFTDVVANNIDFTDAIPTDQLAGDAWKAQVGEGRWLTREAGIIEVLTFSPADDQLKNNPALRKAISRAIDRETITKQIFNGTRTPAQGWVSPVVDGYRAGACGDSCTYAKDQAKQAYEAAGGYRGQFTISVNQDGGHKAWADAVCNNLKNNLGMDCVVNQTPNFRTLLNQAKAGELKGAFRNGWQMDYPSIENFLTPIYAKGAGSNYSRYHNPTFEAKLKEAAAAKELSQANAAYQQAEAMLGQDFPTAPLWLRVQPGVYSNKITHVQYNAFGVPDIAGISVK